MNKMLFYPATVLGSIFFQFIGLIFILTSSQRKMCLSPFQARIIKIRMTSSNIRESSKILIKGACFFSLNTYVAKILLE